MTRLDNKRIARNTLYMYLRMLVTLFVSLFTTRINFKALGIDNYGIYNVVGSIIVFFTFINSGLTSATRRYITAELANGDKDSCQTVFNIAVWAHILIGLVIFVLGETIGLWAANHLLNIPEGRKFAANVVYQLSVFSALLNVMQAPFTAAITANERMNIYAYLSILDVFLKLAVAYIVMVTPGDKLIIYAICIFCVGLVNILVNRGYCYHSFPMCKYKRPQNKSLFKEMFGYMGWSLGGQFMGVMTNQGVTILVNNFFTVAANAAMGISNQITHIVNGFVTNFQVAFHPQITKQYVAKSFDNLCELVLRTSRYSAYLVLIFFIPICCQIDSFLSLWLGEYPQYAVEFCILTLVVVYFDAITGPLWMLLCSDKDIRKYQIIISCIASFNFLGAWFLLVVGLPPYSVVIARIVVYVAILVARLILSKERVPSFPIAEWLKRIVLQPFLISIGPLIAYFFIRMISINNPYLDLFVKAGSVFLITCVLVFLFGFEDSERHFILSKLIMPNRRNDR